MQNSDRRFKMKNLRTLVVFLCLFIASGSALADAQSEQEARISYNFRYGLGSIYLNDFDAILMNIEKMRQKAEILGLKNELKELAQATFQFKHKVKIYRANLLKECLQKTKKNFHNECNKDLNK